MIGAGRVEVDGKDVRLRFVLGSDYKVTIIIETIIFFCALTYIMLSITIVSTLAHGFECSPRKLCMLVVSYSQGPKVHCKKN